MSSKVTLQLQTYTNPALTLCRPSHDGAVIKPFTEVIFVLDTSGSMWWAWPALSSCVNDFLSEHNHMPVTMIQYAKRVSVATRWGCVVHRLRTDFKYAELDQSCDHIYLAFTTLQQHIEQRRKSPWMARRKKPSQRCTNFSVCFVADGGDTESGDQLLDKLKALPTFDTTGVSFTTLACGTGFPTNTSLILRQHFHDPNIVGVPLLTLVSKDEGDLERCFVDIVPHLTGASSVMVPTSRDVKRRPWQSATVNSAAYDTWFEAPEDVDDSLIVGNDVIVKNSALNMDDLVDVGHQWVRELQTLVTGNEASVREEARLALNMFGRMHAEVRDAQEAARSANDVQSDESDDVHTTFSRRLKSKKRATNTYTVRNIVNEFRSLAQSALQGLSDEQLAQRLAIGTKESKYLDRAVRWKGALTVNEFKAARENFKTVYERALPVLKDCVEKDPIKSDVSLESNSAVLADDDFLTNLFDPVLSSQFMLIECLPVVGLGLKTYVSQGTTINPWLVRVDNVSRIVRYVDTTSVYNLSEASEFAQINVGLGKVEEVSAVCPLLVPETASALAPILRSKLYQIIMTFQVTRNMDTVDGAAHGALLAALLSYLVKQASSEWRNELLDSAVFTARALVGASRDAVGIGERRPGWKFSKLLRLHPELAMVTAHPSLSHKCEAISKALLAAAIMKSESDNTQKTDWEKVWSRIVAEYIGRAVSSAKSDTAWDEWYSLQDLKVERKLDFKTIVGHCREDDLSMESFASVAAVVRKVQGFKVLRQHFKVSSSGLNISIQKVKDIRATSNGPVDWDTLESFETQYIGDFRVLGDEARICSFLAHALKYHNSFDRACHPIENWGDEAEKYVMKRLGKFALNRAAASMKKDFAEIAEQRMIASMRSMHEKGMVLPMSSQAIRKARRVRYNMETTAEDFKALRYDPQTGLCRAACQNNGCKRFLLPDAKFDEHLVNSSNSGDKPVIAFHRVLQEHYEKPVEEIEAIIWEGTCIKYGDKSVHVKTVRECFTEDIRRLIPTLRDAYAEFERDRNA